MNNLPIGVFDSGMGGLTVLRALSRALPHESFLYLGDMARLPYGTKSSDTVKQYAIQMTKILVERGVKALVIACNTATTAALPHLQAMLPHMPVLGVVAPGSEAAVRTTQSKKILVLATETTIASFAYHNAIAALCPEAKVQGVACSLLVALAEEGMINNDIVKATLSHYLAHMNDEDTIVLGCTHFPVFRETLSTMYPNLHIVDSAEATALALASLLAQYQLQSESNSALKHYLVTDSSVRFQKVGELFLQDKIALSNIELIDIKG